MQFIARPILIEAFRWTGDSCQKDWPQWIQTAVDKGQVYFRRFRNLGAVMVITALDGDRQVVPGDWVIQGITGELYPCKPEIFVAMYVEVIE